MSSNSEENVSQEALAAARREGAQAERRRGRRRLLVAILISATLFVALLATGWTLVGQARDAAPEVISEIAVERHSDLEQRLGLRADEAAELAAELFGFLQQMWLENESLRQIRSSVQGARAELSLLDTEVRAALDAPLTQLDPLLENGPTRARQLAAHLVEVAAQIQQLVPTVFEALGEAHQTFEDSNGSTIPAMIASMDALIEPFMGRDAGLRSRWADWKEELRAWVGRVEADLALTRQQMRSEALGDEFLERLGRRLF